MRLSGWAKNCGALAAQPRVLRICHCFPAEWGLFILQQSSFLLPNASLLDFAMRARNLFHDCLIFFQIGMFFSPLLHSWAAETAIAKAPATRRKPCSWRALPQGA
jgi:hypothetical protein